VSAGPAGLQACRHGGAEFGIAGILDFVGTEHGLVKATISLDGMAGELYLQGWIMTVMVPDLLEPTDEIRALRAFVAVPGKQKCGMASRNGVQLP
jgi:hypothetical protein